MSDDDAAKVQKLLEQRDSKGEPVFDRVRRGDDGQLLARHADDHTREDRVA